ncbi:FliH/SctL family protein [Arenibacterium sp. CAU 1754]
MSISHLLEDFSIIRDPDMPARLMTEDALEEFRLSAFEQGYTAGWDDAISAQTRDHSRISGQLARNLEDMSFTYHEVQMQMMSALRPLFHGLTETVLPAVMAQSLGEHIVEQLFDLAQDQTTQPAVISVPPGAAASLKPVIAQGFSMPVSVIEDPSFHDGEAGIRVGTSERDIDCTDLLTSIREAVDAFFHQNNKDAQNG